MAGSSTQTLIWRARRLARRLDWLSLCGIGLSLLAFALYLYGVKPLEGRVSELELRAGKLQVRADGQPRNGGTVQPQGQLAAFYERLADARQAPEIASRLHSYARDAGLELEHGEYRPLPDVSGKFVRYQIVLPVNGSYPQVRRFLSDSMRDMPCLALDAISFKREGGGSTQLQTELRFTAFLRKPT